MSGPVIDPADPLFRPLTIEQAAQVARRSQRTIRRWIEDGRITAYEAQNPQETVLIEREVVEVEKANTDAFARGRPPRFSPSATGTAAPS